MPHTTLAPSDQSSGSVHDSQPAGLQVNVAAESSTADIKAAVLADRLAQSRREVRSVLSKIS